MKSFFLFCLLKTYDTMGYPTGIQQKKKVTMRTIMKKLFDLDALYGRSGGWVLYIADSCWIVQNNSYEFLEWSVSLYSYI